MNFITDNLEQNLLLTSIQKVPKFFMYKQVLCMILWSLISEYMYWVALS